MKKHLGWLIALGFCAGSTFAATMTAGYTMGAGSQLLMDNGGSGTNLFVDFAALGGSDLRDPDGMNDTYTVLIDGAGHWRIGDTVELTGFAIPIHQVTGNGTMTLEILQGSGGSGATGAGGLATIGTVTAAYTNGGIVTSTHYVNFDTPVSFVADTNTLKIGINIANSSNIALKHNATHNVIRYNRVNGDLMPTKMQVSLAGNVIASGTTSNSAPEFVSDPFSMTAGFEDIFYTASLLDFVSDPDNDALTLSLLSFSGPGTDWLGVDGTSVTGTPQLADVGVNEWLVQAVDGNGGTNTASMTIEVLPESGFMMGGYTIGSGLLSPHGEILFVDTADAGGANLNDADGATPPYFSVLIPGDGLWTTGDTVRITGLALHLDGFTGNGVMAFEIRQGSGGTGASKAGGLDAIETTYAPYLNSGSNDTMYVNFAQPVEFVADANTLSIGIHISHSTNIRMKEDDGFPRCPVQLCKRKHCGSIGHEGFGGGYGERHSPQRV
jgi:hypothetical protein